MTLFKQIGLTVFTFLMVLLITVMFLNFSSSKSFIQNQLYANAEDTAASLALSLGSVVNEDDAVTTMETMIAAIYDRGYYESIILYDPDKKVILSKSQKVLVKDVPQWFIHFAKLSAPAATSEVSGGWIPFGTIAVKSHVGHAYEQLWGIFLELINTFAILGLIFMLLLFLIIKMILRSLGTIEKQAIAIQSNDFIINEKIPSTVELRHVVTAMNRMIITVKDIFDKEAQALKKYHELLYTDTQTKLYNRRYLSMKISSFLEADSLSAQGSFVLFSFIEYESAKKQLGYVSCEKIVQAQATLMQAFIVPYEDSLAVRMNEEDFALLLPNVKLDEIKDSLKALMTKMGEVIMSQNTSSSLSISAGAIEYTPEDTQKSLFSRADFELSKAKTVKECCSIEFGSDQLEKGLVLGKNEWITMINTSLEENMLKIARQKVINADDHSILHEELYLRLLDQQGNVYNAGYFMPVLINLDLTDSVDKHVIELTMFHAKNHRLGQAVAVNIAADFLKNQANLQWLREKIKNFSSECDVMLNFEASSYNILKNMELFQEFSLMLKHFGYRLGIDNFTIGSEGLEYLQKLKPAYLKASKSFFLDLNSEQNSGASESLAILTKSLGIKLIATSIENQEELEKIKALRLEYLQGSIIEVPEIVGA